MSNLEEITKKEFRFNWLKKPLISSLAALSLFLTPVNCTNSNEDNEQNQENVSCTTSLDCDLGKICNYGSNTCEDATPNPQNDNFLPYEKLKTDENGEAEVWGVPLRAIDEFNQPLQYIEIHALAKGSKYFFLATDHRSRGEYVPTTRELSLDQDQKLDSPYGTQRGALKGFIDFIMKKWQAAEEFEKITIEHNFHQEPLLHDYGSNEIFQH